MRAVPLLALVAFAAAAAGCGRSQSYTTKPPCVRNPEGTPELSLQLANGMPRVWNKEKCIAVTYAPTLVKLKPTLQAALDAWDAVGCTGLCFEEPAEAKDPPTTDFDTRLHLADAMTGAGTAWELLNDGRNGRTLHATLFVTDANTVGDLMRSVGFVLGFEASPKGGRDTVLEEPAVPSLRTELGSIDRQSVCAVYPACRQ